MGRVWSPGFFALKPEGLQPTGKVCSSPKGAKGFFLVVGVWFGLKLTEKLRAAMQRGVVYPGKLQE